MKLFFTTLLLVGIQAASTRHSPQGTSVFGNRFVEAPAPRIRDGQLPGVRGTPASYDPATTSYFFVEPPEERRLRGPVPLLLVLGVRGAGEGNAGSVRALRIHEHLVKREYVLVAPNHGAEDEVPVAIQRGLDCLHDALSHWKVDTERIYVAGHDFGAPNATAIQHLSWPGRCAGLLLSSDVCLGDLEDWSFNAASIALFTGEDDSSFAESEKAYEHLRRQGKKVRLYVGSGVANEAPSGPVVSRILDELWAAKAVGRSKRVVLTVEDCFQVTEDTERVLEDVFLDVFVGRVRPATWEAKIRQGDLVQERIRVSSPSPVAFGAATGFRGAVPPTYRAAEHASYLLYVPTTAPGTDRTLVVEVAYAGGRYPAPLVDELRARGMLLLSPNDISPALYPFAERVQKVLDCIHDARRRHRIDRIVVGGYCAASGTAMAVVHALPGELDGLFLGGGVFAPGDEGLAGRLRLRDDGKVILYARERDWARADVERTHRRMTEAGLDATVMISPGVHNAPTTRRDIARMLDRLLGRPRAVAQSAGRERDDAAGRRR